MLSRRTVAVLTLVAAVTAPGSTASAQSGISGREGDPIVLEGAAVPALLGTEPGGVAAFSYDDSWRQVPVQVDERKIVDFAAVRDGHQTSGRPFSALAYADPGTFSGADSDPALDGDDEIAAMAKDVGDRAPAGSNPAGFAADSRVELAVSDPLAPGTTRYLYLFSSADEVDGSAGEDYVSYDFDLLSGNYKTTYSFSGVPGGDTGNTDAPPANLENSTVDTGAYSQHLLSRWVTDELAVGAGAATGVDILDGDKVQAFYGCGRSELTFSRGGGGFIANIDGPVRAIRSYIGANSGTYTQRDHIYYERAEVTNTYLRVHSGLSELGQFLDYSEAADGMTYRTSEAPAGVTIDGVPDAGLETGTSLGPELGWEQATGLQGTLTILNRVETNIPGAQIGSFYNDDETPSIPQCGGYADYEAHGASGGAIHNAGRNTDPTLDDSGDAGDPYSLTATRTTYFDPPGGSSELAEARADQVDSPLEVAAAVAPIEGLALRAPESVRLQPGEPRRISITVANETGDPIQGVEICGRANRERVRVGRCKAVRRLAPDENAEIGLRVELRKNSAGGRSQTLRLSATADGFEAVRGTVELKRRN